MSAPIPLFVELCAGTAALSLRLHRDGARPPVSRMGAKTGYADVILRILGLMPGQRAAAYLWCEPDPGVRLLLHAYRDTTLAKAAAAIIRSWAAEDPRALWERLRAEGPPRLPEGEVEAGEVARLCTIMRWAYANVPIGHNGTHYTIPANGPDAPLTFGANNFGTTETTANGLDRLPSLPATIAPDARLIDPSEVARYAQIVASNRLIHTAWSDAEGRWVNTGDGGATFGGPAFCSPPERTADGLDAAPADLPAVVAPDAREVDPREVARHFLVSGWAAHGKDAEHYGGPGRCGDKTCALTIGGAARRADALPALPATIAPDARTIDPPTLPPGSVAYMDPPYVATTGYAHDLPRAEVVALARRWAAAGAIVAISEAEPIPELVTDGWHAVRIDAERVGQKRTFSKQQAEWLTLSLPPAWVPAVQASLFGGAR